MMEVGVMGADRITRYADPSKEERKALQSYAVGSDPMGLHMGWCSWCRSIVVDSDSADHDQTDWDGE